MIYSVFIFIFCFLISSCSMLSKIESNEKTKLEDLKNSDFKSRQVKYRSSEDSLLRKKEEIGAFSFETLHADNSEDLSFRKDDDLLQKISTLCYLDKFDEAEKLVGKNEREFKENPTFWNIVGNCFFLKGEIQKSILFYNKSLSERDNYPPAMNNIGVVCQSRLLDQKAFYAYNDSSKNGKFSNTSIFNKAILLLKYGRFYEAEKILKNLYRVDKKNDHVIHALANLYLFKGELSQSSHFYSLMTERKLLNSDLGINYALMNLLSGNKEKYLKILNSISSNVKDTVYFSYVKNLGSR